MLLQPIDFIRLKSLISEQCVLKIKWAEVLVKNQNFKSVTLFRVQGSKNSTGVYTQPLSTDSRQKTSGMMIFSHSFRPDIMRRYGHFDVLINNF